MDLESDETFTQWILNSGLTLEECILIQKPAKKDIPVDQNQKEIRIHIARVLKQLKRQQTASLLLALKRLTEENGVTEDKRS